jgi:poly-gamma-glutamate synthesis protein (capsule biosynthesis protein)
MKTALLLIVLISFSYQESHIRRSRHSKHGEDCFSDSACEEGLHCKINRCMTGFEMNNMKNLGLYETNICSMVKKCKGNKVCIKHRCVDQNTAVETPKTSKEIEEDVHLIFSGSIDLNKKPYMSGYKSDKTFNYDHLFKHISKDIKSADLSVVDQQTVFYINDKEDNRKVDEKHTPKELGDAIAKAGFNLVLHANSKAYMYKDKGIYNTINYWNENHPNIHHLGISSTESQSEKDYFIFNKNGIKIGIINFNGLVVKGMPKNKKYMINTIDINKVQNCVGELKKETDFIIVCMNWGGKTNYSPNKLQIKMAKALIYYGADLIIGNHPHYVQPVSYVRAENGKKGLVFFSLGNLIFDNNKKKNTLGALANIVISKGKGKAHISSYNLIPTINHHDESENEYTVYKLSDYNQNLGLKTNKKFSMEKVKLVCSRIMGAFAHCD